MSEGQSVYFSHMQVLKVVNFGLGVARCFFPPVPVIPGEYMDRLESVLDIVGTKSSAADFACIQDALDAQDEAVIGDPPKQVLL
jgi:hypothetical protein